MHVILHLYRTVEYCCNNDFLVVNVRTVAGKNLNIDKSRIRSARSRGAVIVLSCFTVSRLAFIPHLSLVTIYTETMAEESTNTSNSHENTRKRRKVEEEEEEEEEAIPPADVGTRCEDLWFEEGNVIIAAEGLSFRVHSGILARHSEVFRELLSAAALRDLPQSLEGCPVLRTQDKGAHLQRLIGIIYDGGKRFVPPDHKSHTCVDKCNVSSDYFHCDRPSVQFADLRVVTLMAVKYKVQELVDEVIGRLCGFFPWRKLEDWVNLAYEDEAQPLYITKRDAIAIIPLARLLDAPKLLPMAFYISCGLPQHELVEGQTFGDEVVRLDEADLRMCFK